MNIKHISPFESPWQAQQGLLSRPFPTPMHPSNLHPTSLIHTPIFLCPFSFQRNLPISWPFLLGPNLFR